MQFKHLTNSNILNADINTFDKDICNTLDINKKNHLRQQPTNPYEKTWHQNLCKIF